MEQDIQELDGLLKEVSCQIVELRNLLKEINALKEELHSVHSSLMRTAFNAVNAVKDSADNIVNCICNAITKAEQNTVILAKICTEELAKVNQYIANHIETEKKLLENHRNKLAKHLQDNEDIWLSNRWLTILLVVQIFSYLAVVI